MSAWHSVTEAYPDPEKRVLIATENRTVGIGVWHPEAGWLMEVGDEEIEVEPLYWMALPSHPDIH